MEQHKEQFAMESMIIDVVDKWTSLFPGGETFLIVASRNGYTECVDKLLKGNVDVDDTDSVSSLFSLFLLCFHFRISNCSSPKRTIRFFFFLGPDHCTFLWLISAIEREEGDGKGGSGRERERERGEWSVTGGRMSRIERIHVQNRMEVRRTRNREREWRGSRSDREEGFWSKWLLVCIHKEWIRVNRSRSN